MVARFFYYAFLGALFSVAANAQTVFRTYTTLSGYYDYQTTGAASQYIAYCPASSNINVVYMVATDSTSLSTSRRTAYAYSSNGGISWNNFSNIHVPPRRSGYPSVDVMRGRYACATVIANHSDDGIAVQSIPFVDYPAGSGSFSELNAPPLVGGGSDEPIWPRIACTSDGAIVIVGTTQASCRTYIFRIDTFAYWRPPKVINGVCGPTTVEASLTDSGRVGVEVAPSNPTVGMYFYESTNNGFTWPDLPTYILPSNFVVGTDTFRMHTSHDFTYNHNYPAIAFGVSNGHTPIDNAGIGFWSPPTGFVIAVPHHSIPGVADSLNKSQYNHLTVGYPAIAMSGPNMVIVFQAFMRDTSARGFNYSDIFYTFSSNNGVSWTAPRNLTNTRSLDERFASVSKWNASGQVTFEYQEDPSAGLAAFPGDGSEIARTRQVFCRISDYTEGAIEPGGLPRAYVLQQNYPNPFNPKTEIGYQTSEVSHVVLKVFDMLGREVATLVNEQKLPGVYSVAFDAGNLSSGVYFYRLQAGSFSQTRKLVLMR